MAVIDALARELETSPPLSTVTRSAAMAKRVQQSSGAKGKGLFHPSVLRSQAKRKESSSTWRFPRSSAARC